MNTQKMSSLSNILAKGPLKYKTLKSTLSMKKKPTLLGDFEFLHPALHLQKFSPTRKLCGQLFNIT